MSDEPILNLPIGEEMPSPHDAGVGMSQDEHHHVMGQMLSGAIEGRGVCPRVQTH
jgi:hypothetical protein